MVIPSKTARNPLLAPVNPRFFKHLQKLDPLGRWAKTPSPLRSADALHIGGNDKMRNNLSFDSQLGAQIQNV
jgi:hypothetical protein